MKKKSSRRRTKIVRRSKKNLRRTIKRKNIRKSGRRPTRRYSRIQRGGDPATYALADKLYKEAILAKQQKKNFTTILRNAAKAGDKNANYELGLISEKESDEHGRLENLIEENNFIKAAIKNYAIAAIQGHYQAWLELQRMFVQEYMTANQSKKNTFSDTFLAFKTLQNAALAAVALSAREEKYLEEKNAKEALDIEKVVMQRFIEFADTFMDKGTSENALREVTQFKKKLETFVKKAPKQSVIADADGDDGDGDDADADDDDDDGADDAD